MDVFELRVRATVRRRSLLDPVEPVLAGLSGGPDSTALVAALVALGHPTHAVHVHHGLRREDSDRDAEAAAALAAAIGASFEVVRLVPPGGTRSPEAWARAGRMTAFREAATRRGVRAIATGHTRDDQAETVLYRAARGAGPRGLRGVRPSLRLAGGLRIVRPLLDRTRRDVVAYLRRRRLEPVVDASNADLALARNRIRHETLPSLERSRPGAARALARLADASADLYAWIESEARRAATEWRVAGGGLDVERMAACPATLAVAIVEAANPDLAPLSAREIADLAALLSRPDAPGVRLRDGRALVRDGAQLRLLPPPPPPGWSAPLANGADFPGLRIRGWEVDAGPGFLERFLQSRRPCEEAVDAGVLRGAPMLRLYRAGDRFLPLGSSGERKLQDVFTDLKVPRLERSRAVVLEAATDWSPGAILWVAGRRIDHRARVTPETRRALILSAAPTAISS